MRRKPDQPHNHHTMSYALPSIVATTGTVTEADRLGMVCPVCKEVIDSANKMARHMFTTRHCLPKCPDCDVYIVGRAFKASLQKVIDAERAKEAKQCVRGRERSRNKTAARTAPGSTTPPTSPRTGDAEAPLRIDVASHAHLQRYPHFHAFEKNTFHLAPMPSEDGSCSETRPSDTTELTEEDRAGHKARGLNADGSSRSGPIPLRGFICVGCQNEFGTWTQMTRHLESTCHTFPVCVRCQRHLKCFGPLRPQKHEETTSHSGCLGLYYCKPDYLKDAQGAHQLYTSPQNKFTGFTQLQYKCVCGVVFLHPVLLAEHLVGVHKVDFLTAHSEGYLCRTCNVHLPTLAEMRRHIRTSVSCPVAGDTADTEDGEEDGPVEGAEGAHGSHGVVSTSPTTTQTTATGGFDASSQPQYNHDVYLPNFDPSPFLAYRPLTLGCLQDVTRRAAAAAESDAPHYIVVYQCQDCLYLFTTWERMAQHLQATGHGETYCATCDKTIPLLETPYSNAAGSRSPGNSASSPALECSPASSDNGAAPLPEAAPVREHVCSQHNVLGEGATPDKLEVFLDYNALRDTDHVDPPLDRFAPAADQHGRPSPRDQPRLCFQCPAAEKGCFAVFLHYGGLVEHLLRSGHGATASLTTTTRYDPVPMITYRKRFTNAQLVSHFGFERCPHCQLPFSPNFLRLHAALCPSHWRGATGEKGDSHSVASFAEQQR